MRGKRTLFDDMLTMPELKNSGIGRDPEKIAQRDELLAARYAFYTIFTIHHYEAIIITLSNEFFLSPMRISRILSDNIIEIKRLKNEKPSLRYFRSKWPFMNWIA